VIAASEEHQALQQSQGDVEQEIQLRFEQLRQEVNDREASLLDELAEKCDARRDELESSLAHNEHILEGLACCVANGGRILNSKVPAYRLHCKDFIFSQAKKLLVDEKNGHHEVQKMKCVFSCASHDDLLSQIGSAFKVSVHSNKFDD